MTSPTNKERADWAQAALDAFCQTPGADPEHALCDLLADLMHWADGSGVDFEATLHGARGHYDAEREGGIAC